MKLSKNNDYVLHSRQVVTGDLEGAIKSLGRVLAKSTLPEQRAFLFQCVGKIQAEIGQAAQAVRSFEKADLEDQNSAMTKFQFAKFLAEVIGDRGYAREKCDEIISMAVAGLLKADSIVVFKTNYVDEAQALRDRLQ